jgi:N utilization substance protein A
LVETSSEWEVGGSFHPLFLLIVDGTNEKVIAMNNQLKDILEQVAREKEIEVETLVDMLCSALKVAYQKQFMRRTKRGRQRYKTTPRLKVEYDEEKGKLKVLVEKVVVEEVTDAGAEISLENARRINPNAKVGERIAIEVPLERFTRSTMQIAKNEFLRRIQDEKLKRIYQNFSKMVGEIVSAEVRRMDKRGNVFLSAMGAELFLPVREQVKNDNYTVGTRLRVYIKDVRSPEEHMRGGRTKAEMPPETMILVSRADKRLVEKLFELEIPDVRDKIVEVKAIARDPGVRSKVAVHSNDPNVDPVGACIGQRSKRVSAIIEELHGEQIDVVEWSDDPAKFLANALSPAKVDYVILNEDGRSATVVVQQDQLPMAIGKEGKNVSLAARLAGWRIDIRSYEHFEQMLVKLPEEGAEVATLEVTETTTPTEEVTASEKVEDTKVESVT